MTIEHNSHILIVDDEPVIRKVLTATLQQAGYQTTEADSGEMAMTLFGTSSFDVVISDITMARLSGIDLLFAIKEKSPDTEVITITGYASIETAEAAVAGKAYRYLRKPFDIEDVLEVVAEAVASKQKRQAKEAALVELTYQKNRLQKRLGQLETMYKIIHAIGFPEDPLAVVREVATLLAQVIPLTIMACYVRQPQAADLAHLFLIECNICPEEVTAQLIQTLQKETGPFNLARGRIPAASETPPSATLKRLIEVTFPEHSHLEGSLYLVFSDEKTLSEEEAQLVEVSVVQIAGTIGKFYEFRALERQRLQTLIESMVDGVILFKQGDKISLANQAALTMFQAQTLEQLEESMRNIGWIQKNGLILFKQGQKTSVSEQASFIFLPSKKVEDTRKLLRQAGWEQPGIIEESQWTFGKELELEDGRMLSVTVIPLGDRWEATSTMILRDVTEHNKMRQEIERGRRLSSIGELAAEVVHELNNPFTVMLGYAQILLDENLSVQTLRDVRNIADEIQRCQKIVQDLLALAPSKNQQKTVVNVKEIVEKVLDLTTHTLNKAKVQVVRNYGTQEALVFADGGQLQQVFFNLIKNAKDAMETQNSPRQLEVSLQIVSGKVQIAIADNGTGIAEQHMEKIFDPFFTTKAPGKGTGLGLSICHKIVREHGGRIWCANRLPCGAVFTMELPVQASV
jgi:signal transduction histidine kinase/CheY-like chemotaxis protein